MLGCCHVHSGTGSATGAASAVATSTKGKHVWFLLIDEGACGSLLCGTVSVPDSTSVVVKLTREPFKSAEEVIKNVVEDEVDKEMLLHPFLISRCSEVCGRVAEVLRNEHGMDVNHVVGWWMGACERTNKDRNHEWLQVGNLAFDPTYIQYQKVDAWTWSGAKLATQFSAQFYVDDQSWSERQRRRECGLPYQNLEYRDIDPFYKSCEPIENERRS